MGRPKKVVCYSCGSEAGVQVVDKEMLHGKHLLKYGIDMICKTCMKDVTNMDLVSRQDFFMWLENADAREIEDVMLQDNLRRHLGFKHNDPENIVNQLENLEDYNTQLEKIIIDYCKETGTDVRDLISWKKENEPLEQNPISQTPSL